MSESPADPSTGDAENVPEADDVAAVRDPRTQAAIEEYRRTLRNQAGPGTGSAPAGAQESTTAQEARLLADRPPHWAPRPAE